MAWNSLKRSRFILVGVVIGVALSYFVVGRTLNVGDTGRNRTAHRHVTGVHTVGLHPANVDFPGQDHADVVTSGVNNADGGLDIGMELIHHVNQWRGEDIKYTPCKATTAQLTRKTNSKTVKTCAAIFTELRKCREVNGADEKVSSPLPNFFQAIEYVNQTDENGEIDMVTMKDMYSKSHIGFVHLPKSGGTSVEKLLKAKGRVEQISHCGGFVSGVKMLQSGVTNKTYVFGSKRSYGLHKFHAGSKPFLYLTWLRNPVDKFVSAFFYVKKTAPYFHTLFKKYVKPAKDLTAFLKLTQNVRIQTFDNHFTRLMLFDEFPAIDASFEDCCGSAPSKVPEITETHYLAARRNLKSNMAFVGLTEEFKMSQDMVSYVLGLPILNSDIHVNANPHRINITSWERQEIERRNIWDMKLYEDALEIFEQQKQIYLKFKDL